MKFSESNAHFQNQMQACPCYSGQLYVNCCQKYHQGVLPENALALMRSRYSAYALGLANYIIETTHPQSPHYEENKEQWLAQIYAFSSQVSFDGLEILQTENLTSEAFITFVAHLSQKELDLTFTEKSRFLTQGLAWKYVDGKITKGHV